MRSKGGHCLPLGPLQLFHGLGGPFRARLQEADGLSHLLGEGHDLAAGALDDVQIRRDLRRAERRYED
jgi:hypothetical protein